MEPVSNEFDEEKLHPIKLSLEQGDFDTALPKIISDFYENGKELTFSDKSTPLHYACQHGDLQTAELLVSKYHLDIGFKNETGLTPLMVSAKYGHFDLFVFLLRSVIHNSSPIQLLNPSEKLCNGLKLKILEELEVHKDNNGNTVLHSACLSCRSLPLIKYLIKIGFDPNSANKEDMSCLHLAAKHGCINTVRYLMEEVSCDHFLVDSHGKSPAYIASQNGHLDVLMYLVDDKGANYRFRTTKVYRGKNIQATIQASGRTLLHAASREGHLDTVKYLVSNCQLDPSIRDDWGRTPIYLSCYSGKLEIFKYLLSYDSVLENIAVSCKSEKLFKSLKESLKMHLKRHHLDDNRNTLIHVACGNSTDSVEVVKFLHEFLGLNPNQVDREYSTCLHIAAAYGNLKIVKYLLEHAHSDHTMIDSRGRSAAYLAAGGGHLQVLKYLIEERGANSHFKTTVEWKTEKSKCAIGRTLFHAASRQGHLDVMKYLAESCGCDPSMKDEENITSLYLACQEGHLESVKYLVSLSCDINGEVFEGRTCIHGAANSGNIKLIKYLDSLGLSFQCKDIKGRTPLHYACGSGNKEVVSYLIHDHNLSPSVKDVNEVSCIHLASLSGSIALVKYLIDECKCNPLSQDDQGTIALHFACLVGNTDIVDYLVTSCGCDPNMKNSSGLTCLHAAATSGSVKICQLLVEKYGCDPNNGGIDTITPFFLACSSGSIELIKYLGNLIHINPNLNSGQSILHASIASFALRDNLCSAYDIVKYLIETFNCTPLCVDDSDMTPLHLALGLGDAKTAYYLMKEYSCDPRTSDNTGRSCLIDAVSSCDLDMIKYLIEHWHCDPTVKDNKGMTAFYAACSCEKVDVVQYFVDNNFYSLETTQDGRSCLHAAAFSGSLDILKCLILRCGFEVDCSDSRGLTPLHIACRFGHVNIVKYLISINCDLSITYGEGKTYMHAAVLSENMEVIKYVASDIIVDAPDNNGTSPLHLACSLNNLKIVQYLMSQKCDPNRKTTVQKSQEFSTNTIPCLHIAVGVGNLDVVVSLVSNTDVDINCKDSFGLTPLQLACGFGFTSIVQYMSLLESCDINCKADDGRSCFHAAARSGKLEIVKFLAERNCDSYGKDDEGVTPLHMACAFGNKDTVSFLVKELGCDPYSKTNKNATCLDIALNYGKLDIIKFLMDEFKYDVSLDDGSDPILFIACEGGHLDLVHYLIDNHQCDFSYTNKKGWTCLVAAILGKNLDLVKFLIEEKHCDPLHLSNAGLTPFYASCELGNLEISQYLINQHNCSPNWSSADGRSCLEGAVISGNIELVKLFVEKHNCNPFEEDKHGLTPLFLACAIGNMLIVCYLAALPQCNLNYCSSFRGYSCIHAAVVGGNKDIVECLVEDHGINPNTSTEGGVTPLYLACEEGHVKIIEYLLRFRSCDPNQKTVDGRTCVHAAVVSGNVQLLNILIDLCKCDPHCKSNYGVTPLHMACELGHIDVVEYLINFTECDPNDKAANGWSSFHYAASQNNINVIKYLSKDSYDPTMKNKQVISPFYKACIMERMEIEKGLLNGSGNLENSSAPSSLQVVSAFCKDSMNAMGGGEDGSQERGQANNNGSSRARKLNNLIKKYEESYLYDSNCTDSSNQYGEEFNNQEYSPLHLACLQGFLETVKYLISSKQYDPRSLLPDGQSCLHSAASGGDLATVQYLVEEHNCDPNYPDSAGITSLLIACRKGFTEVVKYLVSQSNSGRDPRVRALLFPMAVRCGHLEILHYLITDLQCDPNRDQAIAPLYLASVCGHYDIVLYLVEKHHSDPLKKSANLDSPLHAAARSGHLDIIKYFIDTIGVDPSPEGEAGNTPLHYAVNKGFLDIINYLLNKVRCDLSCRDHANQTPFHGACAQGNLEVVKCLSQHIVFTNEPLLDGRNNSPLHLAAASGHLEVVKFLMGGDDSECSYIPQIISNPNTRNLGGKTASDEARSHNHMKIYNYLDPEKAKKCMISHTSITESTKTLVLGHPNTGKSTLIEALSKDNLLSRFLSIQNVTSRASGTVPLDIERDEFGKISIFHFIGDQNYLIIHEFILQQFNCPLSLLVINLSLSLEDIERQVSYWQYLLCNSSVRRKMNVIVVASHADTDKAKRNIDNLKSKLHQLIPFGRNVNGINFHDFVCCNCRLAGTSEIKLLRQLIGTVKKQSCLPLSDPEHQLPLLGTSLIKYFKFLSKTKQCMTLHNIQQELLHLEGRDGKLMILSQIKKLHEVCLFLKSIGHLLYLEHDSDIDRNTVVLNDSHILESLNALWQEIQSSLNNKFGVIEETIMNKLLNMNFSNIAGQNMAINCLFISHLACNVNRSQLLIDHQYLPASDSSYYFFSDLVDNICEKPSSSVLWVRGFSKLFAWCLRCKKRNQFFTARFTRLLFRKLISSQDSQVKLIIWKSGVLLDLGQTRCVVELVDRNTQVHVVIQCSNQCDIDMITLRSTLIALTKSVAQLTCSNLEFEEHILLPQRSYPLSDDIRLNSADIASAMFNDYHEVAFDDGIKGKVSLSDVLIFDIFQELSIADIQSIMKLRTSRDVVSPVLVRKVCEALSKLPNTSRQVQEFLSVSTNQDFYRMILKYTIFSDGSIMKMSCKAKSMIEKEGDEIRLDLASFSDKRFEEKDIFPLTLLLMDTVDWMEFGQFLGLDKFIVQDIRQSYYWNRYRCLIEVLAEFVKRKTNPTYSDILQTLYYVMNMKELTRQVADKLHSSDDAQPSTPDDSETRDSVSLFRIYLLLSTVEYKWFFLGLALGIDYSTLEKLEHEHRLDMKSGMIAMLQIWLQNIIDSRLVWPTLASALDNSLVQEHLLAETIRIS